MPTVNRHDAERTLTMLGVPGRLMSRMSGNPGFAADVWVSQTWISERRKVAGYGVGAELQVNVRLDDNCKNGHSTFAITGEVTSPNRRARDLDFIACGCLHDDIAKVFPELAPLIRWHLTSTDGPMHYIADTVYHAGDRDHNGLRAGEARQIINGRTGQPAWTLEAVNAPGVLISTTPTGDEYRERDTVPLFILENGHNGTADTLPPAPVLQWVPMLHHGKGKARDLDAARRSAVWPDATDEELCAEPAELRAALEARHARLMEQFRCDMEAAGLFLRPADYVAPRDLEA